LLPAAGFVPATDQCSGARPRFFVPIEARPSIRPFTLRQRRPTFQSASTAGSTLLACIFEAISGPASDSFGFALPPPPGLFLASRGAFIARNPSPDPVSKLPVCFQTPAPRQDFSIPPDRSTKSDSKTKGLPLQVARSSLAPRRARNNLLSRVRVGCPFR